MAFKPMMSIHCDECNLVHSCWANSKDEANIKVLEKGWAVFQGKHYCTSCASEKMNSYSASACRDMLFALQSLADGSGVIEPIEKLMERIKRER